MPEELLVRAFQPRDQPAAKALILGGLRERWNRLDPSKNPDLDDIAAAYGRGAFLVAVLGGQIVATGALAFHPQRVAEIRRMSVRRDLRRRGIGGAILRRLIADARSAGCRRVILETTSEWTDAVAFYRGSGFAVTHHRGGNTHFQLELNPGPASVV
ncbi:MAG: GNAT family N-acetyltransferase [Anaerolineales bacterium]|nr:GNAT family N-acetyltransferase [Anaerolineales bacterium]